MNTLADWLVRIAVRLRDDGECYLKASQVVTLIEHARLDSKAETLQYVVEKIEARIAEDNGKETQTN